MNDDTTVKSGTSTDTKPKKKKTAPAKPVRVSMCYIGPTIPHVMQKNELIYGEQKQVKAKLNAIAEKHPQFNKLVCPVSELAKEKSKLNAGHNSISNAYGEMLNVIAKEGK